MCSPIERRSRVSICATTALRLITFGFEHRLPAEREELSCHRCGALARLANLLEIVAPRPIALVEQQHVGVADDHGQQVVEVVGDAAGQLTKRFHLLRLHELLLEFPLGVFGDDAIGDVTSFRNQQDDLDPLRRRPA